MVVVVYERWWLTRGSKINIVIRLGNFWYFGKLVAEERWSLTRGCRNQRFDCFKIYERLRIAFKFKNVKRIVGVL